MENKTLEKYELLKAMHTIVQSLNYEGAYFDRWILIIPDGATDEDLHDIAEDEDDEIVIFESNSGSECMAAYMKEKALIPNYGKDADVIIVDNPEAKDYNLRPELGKVYKDGRGSDLLCLMVYNDREAQFKNLTSGWICDVHGVVQHPDGSIEWLSSHGGHFAEDALGTASPALAPVT